MGERGSGFFHSLWDYGILELRLNGLVVVGVGAGGTLTENLGLGDFTDEHHVGAQILLVLHLAGEHGVDVLRQVVKAVAAALHRRKVCELIHVPAGLHTKVANGLEGHILRQHADVELTGLLDDLPGEVPHLAGNHQPGGFASHLRAGVDDAAVVLIVLCRQHEQTIGQIPCGGRVNRRLCLLSESSAPAGPSVPCRDGPRPGPSHGRCRG